MKNVQNYEKCSKLNMKCIKEINVSELVKLNIKNKCCGKESR